MMTDDKFISMHDFAERLGVSPLTISKWLKGGAIPAGSYIRVGKVTRINERLAMAALINHEDTNTMEDTNDE